MKKACTLLIFLFSLHTQAQKPKTEELVNMESAIQATAEYYAYSFSIEKEFQYNNFFFGSRVELMNPFNAQPYIGGGDSLSYNLLLNIRLLQLEYKIDENVRVGVAPVWAKRPLPSIGYYKTPSSVYAHFWLDKEKTLHLITQLNLYKENRFQIELRKKL